MRMVGLRPEAGLVPPYDSRWGLANSIARLSYEATMAMCSFCFGSVSGKSLR
jgi:hypothetical protein